jgi:hypothetical protein
MNLAESAYRYLEDTISIRNKLEEGFLLLADRLIRIQQEMLYYPTYDTFEDFIKELRISRSTAFKIMAVYRKYVLLGGIEPSLVAKAGWSNLCLAVGLITTQDEAKELFDTLSVQTREDAVKTIIERKRGIPMSSCTHANTYTITVCRDCGDKILTNADTCEERKQVSDVSQNNQ